eukprot:CAMPEP_0170471822 /NCGR_PEP_ID=MMETSP0123-20130129/13980_1 /TAXON_ID=182087 /ORGANISM="Favella ehrenbergii, Strain Fehren 1" /LENGTH=77 /DNA_ID=CAMNT_0010739731 /DNA_START=225 /DNA_END=458 /DNA_ORIENTATION=-
MCDHVKQYKIPKEYMYLSDDSESGKKQKKEGGDESQSESSEDSEEKEAKAKEKWERKLYKPTGPDGQGWGDFRASTE